MVTGGKSDFVLKAYKKLSAELETKFGLVEDLTLPQASQPPKPKTGRRQPATITQYFARSVHPHPHPNTDTSHIARPPMAGSGPDGKWIP